MAGQMGQSTFAPQARVPGDTTETCSGKPRLPTSQSLSDMSTADSSPPYQSECDDDTQGEEEALVQQAPPKIDEGEDSTRRKRQGSADGPRVVRRQLFLKSTHGKALKA
eukprot:CAMPEP_0179297666 /NCGR_PEP_ID=MMETSP0797-20121207/45585_1 /TAXON_ID=47934 /ORGANISM="Dinophysis acuminata, Strain DAEP01" /LENGTH=108 /DNA_ID=CAMNT_0021007009 /DNA_START=57 /DNA_END=383 /DNA_ORIENTATION=-